MVLIIKTMIFFNRMAMLMTMMKMGATKWILMRTNHFLIWTRGSPQIQYRTHKYNTEPSNKIQYPQIQYISPQIQYRSHKYNTKSLQYRNL